MASMSASQRSSSDSSKQKCGRGCCSKSSFQCAKAAEYERKKSKDCCSSPTKAVYDGAESNCRDDACRKCLSRPALAVNTSAKKTSDGTDPEKGPTSIEHVVVRVQGMTCVGCETKIRQSLANKPGITNVQASLVLSRAEFDVDTSQLTTDNAIASLGQATAFDCQEISQEIYTIEVLAPNNKDEILQRPLPIGVTSILGEKHVLKINYDPRIVGVREIIASSFGQQLQLAPLQIDPSIEAGNKHVWHTGLMTLFSACLTVPVLVLAWAPLLKNDILYGTISLVLASIVQIFIAGPFYPAALRGLLFARVIEMDLLIVLSTSAAYIFSVVAYTMLVVSHPLSTGEFFETSTLLVTLIMLGRFTTALARQKAIESISIRSLQISKALLVRDEDLSVEEIDVRLLQYGDIVRIMPEAKAVTDGTVISGVSEMDESSVTGESHPVAKSKSSPIVAGSLNGPNTLDIRVTRLSSDNTISVIANMVDKAKLSKPKVQEMADRIAGHFVPIILLITLITFSISVAIRIAVRSQASSSAAIDALTTAIAVLIISCPCAIGLAVPMVIVIAGGVAAKHGIIFTTANSIENAHKATHVVFDKTGTLTQGHLAVVESKYFARADTVQSLLLGLVSGAKHPASRAIAELLQSQSVFPAEVTDVKSLPGKGIQGRYNSQVLQAGNKDWLGPLPTDISMFGTDSTVLCFTINNSLAAIFSLQDTLRSEASSVVSSLQAKGVSTSIVSGDDTDAVRKIARDLHIPESSILSRCSPADKQAYISRIRASCPQSTVIFIGDGTNDAIALASADIGIHMSEGTDVARSAADVVLTRADLRSVLVLMQLSRKTHRRIVFNFVWSFVYNFFAILLAAGAFVDFSIPPAFAGVGEIVSVLPVIAVAIGLRWAKLHA